MNLNSGFLSRITLIFVFLFVLSNAIYARNYYVSSLGSDANTGLSETVPWKTIAKVNSATLASGDVVLFRRGDTFNGSLIPSRSYITFDAYGSGAKPIISGFQTLTGWVNQGNGIYAAPTTAKVSCNMVTVNGANTPMGRFPKTGWLTFESSVGRTSITDTQLTGSPNWTGAEVVIKKNNKTIDRSLITNHSAGTITYNSGSAYNPSSVDGNYNYFLQKSINALTQLGDWYCNGTSLYMYFGTNNPNNYVIKASSVDKTIDIYSRNTNIFQNLTIEGSNLSAAYFYLSVNIQFRNCDIINHGALGISGGGSSSITIDGCNINNCNGKGIDVNAVGSIVKNCSINNIAMLPGMGEPNGASFLGIKLGSTGGLIEFNELTNCGFIPIYFTGNNSKVRYNRIDNFCSLITDGGGIYTYSYSSSPANVGLEVYNNIIMNGYGNGLYSDGVANNVSFHDNTILNMTNSGIQMNTPMSNIVRNNLFYNCTISGVSIANIYVPETSSVAVSNTFSNNLFLQNTSGQLFMKLIDKKTYTIGNFGTSNYNICIVGADGLNLYRTEVSQPSLLTNQYNLTNWKTFSKQEANSTQIVTNLSDVRFEYNATKSTKTIALSVPMIDAKGVKYLGSITLQPFASVILMKDVSPTTPIPPTSTGIYYVSSIGNDANSGLSPDAPWKSLAKVNATIFKSGSTVLFRRGDTFLGSLVSSSSYVTFGAYGTGSKPVISGFQAITGWVNQGNGIYSAPTMAKANCNMVTVNGVNTPMGRYPKTGWLSFESFTGRTSITDTQLTATPNWTGAEVVIKKNNWTVDRSAITSHANSTLNYTSGSTYSPVSVYGNYNYFIQKSLNTLTQFGDWYCNGTNIYMYFGSNNPANYIVKNSVVDKLIVVNSINTNVFQDLAVEGSNINGVYVYLSVNIQFKNCDILNHGALGIFGGGSTKILVEGCSVSNCNGKGIDINAAGSLIKNCNISNIAMVPGMGEPNGASYLGIKFGSVGGIIEYNNITNCGYLPISFVGNNSKVRYNKVDGFCSILTDGGAIYTYNNSTSTLSSGMEVYNNIIMNGGANGLYSDGVANNISFHDNTVFNVAKNGIHMNNSISNIVSNNMFYNCAWAALSVQNIYDPEVSTIASNNVISNNIIVQGANNQRIMSLNDAKTLQIVNFGTSNNNKFIVESSLSNLFNALRVLPSYSNIYYNYTNWKTLTGKEANSTFTTTILSEIQFEYNASPLSKTIALSSPMIDAKGTKYAYSVTLLPYTSVALMKDVSLKSGSISSNSNLLTSRLANIDTEVSMTVFPNPSNGRVTVSFSELPTSSSRIDILDLSGRKVLTRFISNNIEEFDLENQSAGMYVVKCYSGSTELIQKLILNK